MKYYRLIHYGWADNTPLASVWDINIRFGKYPWWELKQGHSVQVKRPFLAHYDDRTPGFTDFPLSTNLVHVLSPRFKRLLDTVLKDPIQYIPIHIKSSFSRTVLTDYVIANYLNSLECLDETHSEFEKWTTDNLPFLEKRTWMLGTYRDIRRTVLKNTTLAQAQVFLVRGSHVVIFREDVKTFLEGCGITGCQFLEVELS